MDQTEIVLLETIRKSLFAADDVNAATDGVLPIPDEEESTIDWDAVINEAKKQTVQGFVVDGMPQSVKEKWQMEAILTVAVYTQIMHAQDMLIELFSDNKIPIVILKGSAAAIYYPAPSLRSMGDIDFIVPVDRFDEARKVMESNGYIQKYDDDASDRHIGYGKDRVHYELHHHFSHEGYAQVDKYVFDGLRHAEKRSIEDHEFFMLPKLANGIVLLDHMRSHLQSGMGLRQLIDWMMFVDNELDDEFWNSEFRDACIDTGLEKLAVVATSVCRNYLGLDKDIQWCDDAYGELASDLSDEFIDFLFSYGNFGVKRGKGNSIETVSGNIRKRGLFRYLQHAGKYNWKAYKKHHWLAPFAWIYQIGRYARLGFAAKRGTKVLTDMSHSKKRSEMLRKLDI